MKKVFLKSAWRKSVVFVVALFLVTGVGFIQSHASEKVKGIRERDINFNLASLSEETHVVISSLPDGVEAQDGDLDADPIIITSQFEIGENTLLSPESVDTADEYGNIVQDSPVYGVSFDVGLATVDSNKACSITFFAGDIGKTATVTIAVSGVASSKQL